MGNLNFVIPDDLHSELKAEAAKLNIKITEYIHKVLKERNKYGG